MVSFHFNDKMDFHIITLDEGGPKAGFTLHWCDELGWERNPFRPREPVVADMAEERKELNLFFVKDLRLGVVHGSEGMGKTELLQWLSRELEGQSELRHQFLDASTFDGTEFRERLAKPFHGLLSKKAPENDTELVELVKDKKGDERRAVLIDNADELTKENKKTIGKLIELDVSFVLTSKKKLRSLPADDELGLELKKRSVAQYIIILSDLISAVGGNGMQPFTESVVERMARDTKTTREFIDLAEETAINVALKRAEVPAEVSDEELVTEEEPVAEKKKGIKPKPAKGDAKSKREYDKLVASLADEIK